MNQLKSKLFYSRDILQNRKGDPDFVAEYFAWDDTLRIFQCRHCSAKIAWGRSCYNHAMIHSNFYESLIADEFEDIALDGRIRCRKCGQDVTMSHASKHHHSGKCDRNARFYVPEQNNDNNDEVLNPIHPLAQWALPEEHKQPNDQRVNEDPEPEVIRFERPLVRPPLESWSLDPKGLARRLANEINLLAQRRANMGGSNFKYRVQEILEEKIQEIKDEWSLREDDFKELVQDLRKELLEKDAQIQHQGKRIDDLEKEVDKTVKLEDLPTIFSEYRRQQGRVMATIPPYP